MIKKLAKGLIYIYQRAISPYMPHVCRHVPSCSPYALEALEQHGPLKGGCLALWRILRCHPLGSSGYDPVPQKNKPAKGLL